MLCLVWLVYFPFDQKGKKGLNGLKCTCMVVELVAMGDGAGHLKMGIEWGLT